MRGCTANPTKTLVGIGRSKIDAAVHQLYSNASGSQSRIMGLGAVLTEWDATSSNRLKQRTRQNALPQVTYLVNMPLLGHHRSMQSAYEYASSSPDPLVTASSELKISSG